MFRPRWEGDTRGRGIARAASYAAGGRALLERMLLPDWVAEDAPVHLLPALQAVLQGGQLPLQLIKAQTAPDGTFVLDLAWAGEPPSWRSQREAVFTLIGSIAETCTYVREQPAANGREFEIVTGQLPGDGPFGEHGHTLRLRISGT